MLEICIIYYKQGSWYIRTGVWNIVNRVPLRWVWPSRHLLHQKMTNEKYKVLFFTFMKISNARVTSKQNVTEKYRLMKNLDNQNCSWKNEVNINRVSEISKIHCLDSFFLLQLFVDLSLFEQNLQEAPQSWHHSTYKCPFASIQFEKLHHKGIRLNNVCVQWVFTIINFSQNSAKYCGVCQLQKE